MCPIKIKQKKKKQNRKKNDNKNMKSADTIYHLNNDNPQQQ